MRSIRKIVVVGANGVMGTAAGAVFAAAGFPTVFLARTREKAEAGRARAERLTRGKIPPGAITCGSYADPGDAIAEADLVLEAVAEDMATKREVLAWIDRLRPGDAIVATGTSGLSIASLCAERSASFRSNFLGVHLFNPPTAIAGCELVPHAGTDPGAVAAARDVLTRRCGREVVETSDTPGFAGNRIGFQVLNQIAQLAEDHGVLYMDQLVGPHTGRALPPLATIDLVGWDVHQAIVDRLHGATCDIAHAEFALPAYMRRGIARGHLGRKTPDRGGFYRIEGAGAAARQLVLDPATGDYRPVAELARPLPAFVDAMRAAIRDDSGRGYLGAMEILCAQAGTEADIEADLLRRILLGYISYGLGLVGEVVERPRDVDRIMAFGFHWAPPGLLVDAIGPGRTIALLERARLPVPQAIVDAAVHQRALFDEPRIDRARLFPVAA
ncbi:MAG TPA: 3-hydroxyacyl-CoA dehydrogenase family protein [Kofleriaceae bacterium]